MFKTQFRDFSADASSVLGTIDAGTLEYHKNVVAANPSSAKILDNLIAYFSTTIEESENASVLDNLHYVVVEMTHSKSRKLKAINVYNAASVHTYDNDSKSNVAY